MVLGVSFSTFSALAQVSEPVFSAIVGLGAGTMINSSHYTLQLTPVPGEKRKGPQKI